MYFTLLAIHSLLRWLVLISLVLVPIIGYTGWLTGRSFTKRDNLLRLVATTVCHIQAVVGITLYFVSPVIDYFLHNYGTAVHMRQIRFFGMEHSLMMLVAVVLVTIGSAKAKRKTADKDKFKTLAVWFTIGLVVVLLNIPWPFSPLVARPFLRGF